MIPKSVDISGAWNVLPPGIHDATLEEIEQRFASNEKRRNLFDGLCRAVDELRKAGCGVLFLDGSFVTDKPEPGDFDVCWDPVGVNPQKLDPVFLDFSQHRKKQKDKYGGEFFPSSAKANRASVFLDFFQTDRDTGLKKGIIKVQLR